jgi:penicillin-binding protein 1A
MGIDSSKVRSDGEFRVPNQPSICLGSADLSVMEMTGAYATFANNGLYTQPLFVLTIEDEHGREIYRHIPNERQALPPKANYVMVDMLKYAGTNLGGITGEVGGKTGTTNDYVDGWFVGITPTLVVGTWVGGEDPWIRFLSLDDGQGSVMAKPFFREFIKRLQNAEDVDFDPKARFSRPPGDLEIEIDCEKYRSLQSKYQAEEFHDSGFFEDEFIEQQ